MMDAANLARFPKRCENVYKYHTSRKDHYIYNYAIWAALYKAYSTI
jgi:hypothetical protein